MSENPETGGAAPGPLFYRQVSPLNPDRHGGLKIAQPPNQSFAAAANTVPLAGVEFIEACKEYPIVFVRAGEDAFAPVAVLGLELGENLFLDDAARWKAHYTPAFVRRYPFILADNPADPGQPLVCIDEACPWLGQEGEPLFVERQPSDYLKRMLEFINDYNAQSQRTASFARKLAGWGLLKESQAQATTAEGRVHTLNGFWVADEAALGRAAPDQLQELAKTGELAWLHFHLASLSNFRRLAARKPAAPAAAGQVH